mmetsp:Transcript_45848/g.76512  ORF Transcript_45848/g.76512 Transcript_45848/m.76512 type:complete len:123 (-) Transcript_45848:15-383(-)
MSTIGIPVKLLHESVKHVVTMELKNGEIYRGQLHTAEDNMNCQLKNVTMVHVDGRQSKLDFVFIRGSKIRWVIVPDMLVNAPMFKRAEAKGLGRGYGFAKGRSNGAGARARAAFRSNLQQRT